MTNEKHNNPKAQKQTSKEEPKLEEERGGFGEKGNGKPEPTRYNDWEVDGRCSDF